MAPKPIPPSEIKPLSTSLGIEESHGGAEDAGQRQLRAQEGGKWWQTTMVEQLSDSTMRSLTVVLSDPSQQNVAQAVKQLSAADEVARSNALQILTTLMKSDYLSKSDEVSAAMEEIMSSFPLAQDARESSSVSVNEQ